MSNFIALTCPACGGKTRILPGTERYICDYCGNEHLLKQRVSSEPSNQPLSRGIIATPKSVVVDRDGQTLRLVRRWFSWKYVPLAFFCIAWDSFLCFWYSMAFNGNAPWIMIVFPIAHLAVGVGLTYSTLAGFLNRSVLEVTPKLLSVWHEPVLWTGNKDFDITSIKQIYCTEKVSRGDHSTTYTYELNLVTKDGKKEKLLTGLDEAEIGLFIEQQIESWLMISDTPVAGELPRKG
jgi:DNA-directed RNA polymerase subunit RPC12/RpoP